ncbi:MAG: class II fumarate hydratase [Planctomycetota bacterium]
MSEYRIEKDSMGEMKVPAGAYYAAQTQRAVENFPVSGIRFPRRFIQALGLIKCSAALANMDLGLLGEKHGQAIIQAGKEVSEGKLDGEFVLDIFQTGSGTSTNMNTNEVMANRASEILGAAIGSKEVHPNDHVNMSQSSNDVIPTAIHVAALLALRDDLRPALEKLHAAFDEKSKRFDHIVKSGRTHLMDATPVRLGQEFAGYASHVEHAIQRVDRASLTLSELAQGGTAVGTGVNTPHGFSQKVIEHLNALSGLQTREAMNHFEAQGGKDAVVEASGMLKVIACSLMKIANDIRWLASGPRCGLGEITLPSIQPGSSIMPGKVNPVICEAVTMVAAQVIGNDTAITIGGQGGNFELNVYMPMMAHNLLQSIELLANVSHVFVDKCIEGIEADEERCRELVEKNLAVCTALAPAIGYDKAAALSKRAFKEGRNIREVALEEGVLSEEELDRQLDLRAMTEPNL